MATINDARLITLFGGGGFVGRYVSEALLKRGFRLRIAERNPADAFRIRPLGRLGQMQFASVDITRPAAVARAVAGSWGVVNLVGAFANMDAVHAEGAGHIAEAARDADVAAMLHISAIGADPASPARYGRSKAAGEARVRAGFPAATIFRPSIIFGAEDQFLNRFAGLIASTPVVPVIGADARFQPVFVGDVAEAAGAVMADPAAYAGRTFELGGPDVLTMIEINRWIAGQIGRDKPFIAVPDAGARALAYGLGWAPGAPITPDQLKMLGRDTVVAADAEGFAALGIDPVPMAAVAPNWLVRFRKAGRFSKRTA